MNEHHFVRLMLFSVPVLCALQWLVVRKIGEPYPAVMMPSFAGDAKPSASVLNPTLIIEAANGHREVSAYQIFSDLPNSTAVRMVHLGLRYDRKPDREAADWLWQRVMAIEPNAKHASIHWNREFRLTNEPTQWLGALTIR